MRRNGAKRSFSDGLGEEGVEGAHGRASAVSVNANRVAAIDA
jgi:hypothetical protein